MGKMQNNRMMGKFYDKSTSVKTQRTLKIKEKKKTEGQTVACSRCAAHMVDCSSCLSLRGHVLDGVRPHAHRLLASTAQQPPIP